MLQLGYMKQSAFRHNQYGKQSKSTICTNALKAPGHGSGWDMSSAYEDIRSEAIRRGYTPESCAKALGRTIQETSHVKKQDKPKPKVSVLDRTTQGATNLATEQGTVTYADGGKYVGEFRDSKRHGQGTYIFADGDKYVGEWKDDKIHGQGTQTRANGDKYVGEYKDNKAHGQGTYTFANGSKYVGEFRDSKKHGQGTIYAADGTIMKQGYWENGGLVRTTQAVSSSNTSAKSFKRKMCESAQASEDMKASFMQSISKDELSKFLKSGQDCSIF